MLMAKQGILVLMKSMYHSLAVHVYHTPVHMKKYFLAIWRAADFKFETYKYIFLYIVVVW